MEKENKKISRKRQRRNFLNRLQGLDWVIFAMLLVYAILIIYPFYNAFLISISPEHVYLETPILLWPKEVTFDNYRAVFTNKTLWSGFGVTMFLLLFGTAYQLFFTVITGYALSRNKWIGKGFLMNMILVTMFFGGGLIPYYFLIKNLGLYNTIWVMVIPGAIDTYNMLLMRNYFASLPADLEESAKIDGANDIQIFVKVYLPMALPMLATVGLFFAVGNWNSWYNGMLFIEKANLKPLQLILRELIATSSSQIESPIGVTDVYSEGLQMACIFFTIVPMMSFYPFVQKFFVKGLVVGAIKG
ncbi:MAG: carbohydrate ABC transporter permease [Gammaproteobacteria bacterium]|nr:carbohydrate ABC transporter permease [Gammaproteobacteria bacterium]